MKPIQPAESIKYIILVSITTNLCGMSEYACRRACGIIIAQASGIKTYCFSQKSRINTVSGN
jgi:hypothetical protein